jgi:hypothetical protein
VCTGILVHHEQTVMGRVWAGPATAPSTCSCAQAGSGAAPPASASDTCTAPVAATRASAANWLGVKKAQDPAGRGLHSFTL